MEIARDFLFLSHAIYISTTVVVFVELGESIVKYFFYTLCDGYKRFLFCLRIDLFLLILAFIIKNIIMNIINYPHHHEASINSFRTSEIRLKLKLSLPKPTLNSLKLTSSPFACSGSSGKCSN